MSEENRRFVDKIALRLPEGMRAKLAAIADRNNRSTNAEIVARLEWSLAVSQDIQIISPRNDPSSPHGLSVEERLGRLEERVEELYQLRMNEVIEHMDADN